MTNKKQATSSEFSKKTHAENLVDAELIPNGCPSGETVCPIYEQIEQLRHEVRELKAQVVTDPLTGLHNRRHMFTSLEQECERTKRTGQPTTIALIDLDHFKQVNDLHGHTAGDTVLKTVANIILNSIRRLDIACRYGGEEFCIIFPGSYILTAHTVAQRVRAAIARQTIDVETTQLSVTASIGLSCYTKDTTLSLTDFINRADEELYKAKHEGRNRVSFNEGSHQEDATTVTNDEKDALFNAFKK